LIQTLAHDRAGVTYKSRAKNYVFSSHVYATDYNTFLLAQLNIYIYIYMYIGLCKLSHMEN